jgi:hypothetical protein
MVQSWGLGIENVGPKIPLPMIDAHLRAADSSAFMSDMDISEMLLNYVLHESMQALCGVDLSSFFGGMDEEGKAVKLRERWTRAAMRLETSPYQAVQAMLVAKELIKGDRKDPNNAFRWDVVRLNLPGSKNYGTSISWLSKIRVSRGQLSRSRHLHLCRRCSHHREHRTVSSAYHATLRLATVAQLYLPNRPIADLEICALLRKVMVG